MAGIQGVTTGSRSSSEELPLNATGKVMKDQLRSNVRTACTPIAFPQETGHFCGIRGCGIVTAILRIENVILTEQRLK